MGEVPQTPWDESFFQRGKQFPVSKINPLRVPSKESMRPAISFGPFSMVQWGFRRDPSLSPQKGSVANVRFYMDLKVSFEQPL